ncbi:hypothetical protein Bsp3421_004402 [Burkholderia sp. FERM BP-3421]|uniref:hypothetical protein n=1 Tax=Burkholderia sp. FERM BP-3421 TaxID=1494466 RepID=UPI00235EE6BD|nr:hypothetical protein [Burkholderia sp. FERM BP-3421]WDD94288.1 hypothetical protein Bsp3421_004402 [Burkholderia sp. FERM BP-3421]
MTIQPVAGASGSSGYLTAANPATTHAGTNGNDAQTGTGAAAPVQGAAAPRKGPGPIAGLGDSGGASDPTTNLEQENIKRLQQQLQQIQQQIAQARSDTERQALTVQAQAIAGALQQAIAQMVARMTKSAPPGGVNVQA